MKSFFAFLVFSIAFAARAENALIVGDSHSVGPFGKNLERLLAEKSYVVDRRATSGASAHDWLTHLDVLRPVADNAGLLVIALGTNDANQTVCQSTDDVALLVLALRAPKARCAWIGPPNFPQGPIASTCGANYDAYVDRLADAAKKAGCTYFDSRAVRVDGKPLAPNENDQLHFRDDLAKVWATEAVNTIAAP